MLNTLETDICMS